MKNKNRDVSQDPARIKFLCSVNNDQFEEVLTYQEILAHIDKDDHENDLWKFKSIIDHSRPLTQQDPEYMGSRYNIKIEWETGEVTWEPLNTIGIDDPVSCAIYAKEHGLLNKE